MRKRAFWSIALSLLLLLSACSNETKEAKETKPTEFLVECFECNQEFASEQLNTDFGLCQDCMMKVGAAYCQNCDTPCYTRDMVQGLCQSCNAESTASQDSTTRLNPTASPEFVVCEYCGYSVRSDYMISGHCAGCFSVRKGFCLRCIHNSHLPEGCHCEHCSSNWFYCGNCEKRTAGNEMILDLCLDCYWRINSVFVPCPLCGKSIAPAEVMDGYCKSCNAQENYEEPVPTEKAETYRCSACGREYKTSSDLYGGKCWSCYNNDKDLCISCQKQPSEGLGPSGMECANCYYQDYDTCINCGYDFLKEDLVNGYCVYCSYVPLLGTFTAEYENVKIIITYINNAGYCLTYMDLTSGITLRDMAVSYYNSDTPTDKSLMFVIEDYYPEYSGYVEFIFTGGHTHAYSYNALIEGLTDSGGYYSTLTKQ
mgnify:CR=1 FL=1